MNIHPWRIRRGLVITPLVLFSLCTTPAVGDELASPWLEFSALQIQTTPTLQDNTKDNTLDADKAKIRVTNTGNESFVGPLRVVISKSSREVLQPDGYTDDNKPFFLVSKARDYALAPGGATGEILVEFGKTVKNKEPRQQPSQFPFEAKAEYSPSFMLQLLHTADMDGATGALQNIKNFSGLLNYFRNGAEASTVTLSSGDNFIPGPRYTAAEDERMTELLGIPGAGRGDIVMLNAMGFQASAVGNHDLDGGTAGLAADIAPQTTGAGSYKGTLFPYLSANLDFTTDANLVGLTVANGQDAKIIQGRLTGSATIEVNGDVIGVVGATTPKLASITSTGDITVSPADSDDIQRLAQNIQSAVDALTATGINKVILLAHMQQINIEIQLATLLHDVDIIVAGGSNTLLADGDDVLRDGDVRATKCTAGTAAAGCTYPIMLRSATGEPVLVVNTDGDYKYLGRLVLGFDGNGLVVEESLDSKLNGAWATDDTTLRRVGNPEANKTVVAVADALTAVLAERDGNILGATAVYLDGRRSQVRTQETNLGDLSADANLWVARQVDPATVISLRNGGGIRDDIGYYEYPPGSVSNDDLDYFPPAANPAGNKPAGTISQFDLQGAMRFNNGLTLVTVTARQLQTIIEHGVAASTAGATPGQFPQVAGIRFSFNPKVPAGSRIQSLVVEASGGDDMVIQGGILQGDADRTFRMVTLDFLAKGGDDYPFPAADDAAAHFVNLTNAGVVADDLGAILSVQGRDANFAAPGSEQDALAEYLQEYFNPALSATAVVYDQKETPATEDERIQNLSERIDTVIR